MLVSYLFKGEQMGEESVTDFHEDKESPGSLLFKRILLVAAVIVAKSLIDELIYYAEKKIGDKLSDAIFNSRKAWKDTTPPKTISSSPFGTPQSQLSLYGNQNQPPTGYGNNPFTYR